MKTANALTKQQKAEACRDAVLAVDLATVPVMTTQRHILRIQQATLLRQLLKRFHIPYVSVTTPRYSMASTVDVRLPALEENHDRERWPHTHGECCRTPFGHTEETRCRICAENSRIEKHFERILAAAFPNHDDRSDTQTDYFDYCWSVRMD